MSKTNAPSLHLLRRRPLAGALLSVLAWVALLVAPVAAQAMTRIDPGVPGAIICSVNKAADAGDGKAFVPHCQLCTLAQQAVEVPAASSGIAVPVLNESPVTAAAADAPPSRAPPRAHPPRAPPIS
jgi:hypothetical protein